MAIPQDDALLLDRFRQRDRRALAQVLSRVESGKEPAWSEDSPSDRPAEPHPPSGDHATHGAASYAPAETRVVGITGSGGAGKSTLIGALIQHLRQQGLTVAVLACDPQSPLSGGALLGDRIRVEFPPDDEGVYFRSLSTRGAQGGVSAAIGAAIPWLRRFGFDVVLVETVGVGQDQIAVREFVDTLLLLITPNTGDEVQWEKAGVIEVADAIVVNKSDLPGADRVRQQLTSTLNLLPGSREVPVLATVAAKGQGVPQLWEAIQRTGSE
jgi:LAO/AO transport system kinase